MCVCVCVGSEGGLDPRGAPCTPDDNPRDCFARCHPSTPPHPPWLLGPGKGKNPADSQTHKHPTPAQAPAEERKHYYLALAQLEETHGLASNAMRVYEEAAREVPAGERLAVYSLYVQRAREFYGADKVREAYAAALEAEPPHAVPDADAVELGVRFARFEAGLGEWDRARAIFVHVAPLADPRAAPGFWRDWAGFETSGPHGNEETFREMMRIQRSVAAAHSQAHFNTGFADAVAAAARGEPAPPADSMQALEAELAAEGAGAGPAAAQGTKLPGFVSAGVIQQGGDDDQGPADGQALPENPEDIDIGDDDDDDDDVVAAECGGGDQEAETEGLQQKTVPDAVFGSLAPPAKKTRYSSEG